jgi:hypothetical protein
MGHSPHRVSFGRSTGRALMMVAGFAVIVTLG